MVGGASAVILTAGWVAAPDAVEQTQAQPGADDPCAEGGTGAALRVAADDDRDIDPDSNSGRGNSDDSLEERERDDDPSDDDQDEDAPVEGGVPSASPAPPAGGGEECGDVIDGPVVTNIRGDYQVRLHIVDGVVVDVEFPVAGTEAAESRQVNAMALPVLEERILEAQSADVEYVSGASYTSPAMVESAQAAFDDAGL